MKKGRSGCAYPDRPWLRVGAGMLRRQCFRVGIRYQNGTIAVNFRGLQMGKLCGKTQKPLLEGLRWRNWSSSPADCGIGRANGRLRCILHAPAQKSTPTPESPDTYGLHRRGNYAWVQPETRHKGPTKPGAQRQSGSAKSSGCNGHVTPCNGRMKQTPGRLRRAVLPDDGLRLNPSGTHQRADS